ncbi:MAG: hypothetical protein GY953_20100, partial [bacterium]|nr:hypothetical protein [bacterium]
EAKEELSRATSTRAETAEAFKELEGHLASVQDPRQRRALEEQHREFKRRLNMWTREELQLRAAEVDAGNELATKQATLDELRDRLDRLERQLEAYGTTAPAK